MTDRLCLVALKKLGAKITDAWSEHSMGGEGDFQWIVRRNRMGIGTAWTLRVRVTSPIKRDLIAAAIQTK